MSTNQIDESVTTPLTEERQKKLEHNIDKGNIDENNIWEKGNGTPYAEQFDKEYNKMTKEEKQEVDEMMELLKETIGLDD